MDFEYDVIGCVITFDPKMFLKAVKSLFLIDRRYN